ncbi:hypothetical protein O181_092729 [Austropuccinia psidii MF-1]|uniref:CRAL-TRIO domain-containing protein n=1 Tax=Austropuccinia psidii MF-1 TaxID=1389203 RepID=A0A9Q3J021_9BASI|nr:hypothetical protein [Austropuccinia psidii MF-1]
MTLQSGNPLPDSGLVDKLTSSQYSALKAFWRELFRLVDDAPEKGQVTFEVQDINPQNEIEKDPKDSLVDPQPGPPPVIKDENLKEKLRAEQELRDAKVALEKYGSIRFMDTFWNMIMMDDPDVIVLKFLRARKWNVPAGVAMMAACLKWRIEYGVEKIVQKGEEGYLDHPGFLHQFEVGKTFVQGTDRQGRPVVYINVRLHKASDQSPKTLEEFIVLAMESVRLMLTPPSVEKATIIIDMSGFGLANMDWKSLAFIVKCLESYYPESLNVLVVHNPPWVFHGLWKIIAPMLDPVVRAKIQITKSSEDLKVHIDEKHLIESLGGKSHWKWEYEPVQSGENSLMADLTAKQHELQNRKKIVQLHAELTRKWYDEALPEDYLVHKDLIDEDLSVIAQLRKFITYHLRVHYFVLDPYVRGRTVYHRTGRIIGNGLITFEYPRILNEEKGEEVDRVEVLGYSMSKENLMIEIEKFKSNFNQMGIEFPSL